MYTVGFERANLLKMALVTVTAMLAVCLLALVETNTARATSLPKNGKITFSRLQYQGNNYYAMDLYTVNPDGSSLGKLTNNFKSRPLLAWSPDGTKIAFEYQGSIWVIGADGSNLRRLTPNRPDGPYYGLAWSPDGTKLAFTRLNTSCCSDLYTMDVDGSNITNITRSPHLSERGVDFSPDGSQMCLDRDNPNLNPSGRIYVMNVDGSNLTRLTEPWNVGCDWSPDGTKIAYVHASSNISEAEPDDLYVMNADGSEKKRLTSYGTYATDPEWSPDGTRIAFRSDRDSGEGSQAGVTYSDIYTMDTDGSDVVRVTKTPSVSETESEWLPLTPKTRSMTVNPPDTGGPSLLLVASALFFSVGSLLYAVVRRRM